MEVLLLSPFSGERPPPAPVHWLGTDESFTEAPELGMLGKIFNQDLANMAKVQKGLETSKKGAVTMSDYMESKVRWAAPQAGRVDRRRRTSRHQRRPGRAVMGPRS